jgi:hypothetical protein
MSTLFESVLQPNAASYDTDFGNLRQITQVLTSKDNSQVLIASSLNQANYPTHAHVILALGQEREVRPVNTASITTGAC